MATPDGVLLAGEPEGATNVPRDPGGVHGTVEAIGRSPSNARRFEVLDGASCFQVVRSCLRTAEFAGPSRFGRPAARWWCLAQGERLASPAISGAVDDGREGLSVLRLQGRLV